MFKFPFLYNDPSLSKLLSSETALVQNFVSAQLTSCQLAPSRNPLTAELQSRNMSLSCRITCSVNSWILSMRISREFPLLQKRSPTQSSSSRKIAPVFLSISREDHFLSNHQSSTESDFSAGSGNRSIDWLIPSTISHDVAIFYSADWSWASTTKSTKNWAIRWLQTISLKINYSSHPTSKT